MLLECAEAQISQIDLLLAMYPAENDIMIDAFSISLINELRLWVAGEGPVPSNIPDALSIALNLTVTSKTSQNQKVQLVLKMPLQSETTFFADTMPIDVKIRQPQWMTRSESEALSKALPQNDVLSAVEFVLEEAPKLLDAKSRHSATPSVPVKPSDPLVRVWFYFPSLSTREKRTDLVKNGPIYGLTGFVLAGKPGVLCLEGTSSDIDAYMKFIKTKSWGDIPSHQKKVSERYREESPSIRRAFDTISEITDLLGERRGERANRGDMKALESWLGDHGLESAFEKVLM